MNLTARPHLVTPCPAAGLPGMLQLNFLEPRPEITTPGGNVGHLITSGCAVEELAEHIALLEHTHKVKLIVTGQVPQ